MSHEPRRDQGCTMTIVIPPQSLEAHFVYFYDLKVKVLPVKKEQTDRFETSPFSHREVADSELSTFYFSDSFLSRWIRLHFHGKPDRFDIESLLSNSGYKLAAPPQGGLTSYAAIECTLFENGILAVTLRVQNLAAVNDSDYLDSIARPEYLFSSKKQHSGKLISVVDKVLRKIEPEIAFTLNTLHLQVIHIEGGAARPLRIMSDLEEPPGRFQSTNFRVGERIPTDNAEYSQWQKRLSDALNREPQPIKPGETLDPMSRESLWQKGSKREKREWAQADDAPVLHFLKRSRPFVGTVVDFMGCDSAFEDAPEVNDWRTRVVRENGDQKLIKPEVYRLAIAAARTTPQFLQSFSNLEQYWTETPRRDIYYPGPSIVFIGRRGWTCIKLERRSDELAFHLGVVETVLFLLQATIASFRATRSFIEKIKDIGDEVGISLNKKLAMGDFEKDEQLPRDIHRFTAFLARARLHAPVDDMSVLLRSYLMTHTGIAAVRRIRELLRYDEQMEHARHTLVSYAASLQGANQYWISRNAQATRKSSQIAERAISQQRYAIILAAVSVLIAVISFLYRT